jgi:hypothetical protein
LISKIQSGWSKGSRRQTSGMGWMKFSSVTFKYIGPLTYVCINSTPEICSAPVPASISVPILFHVPAAMELSNTIGPLRSLNSFRQGGGL